MAQFGHVDARPRLLLVHMALMAIDPPGRRTDLHPPAVYFAPWHTQALALGYPLTESSERLLRRQRRVLLDAKAVEVTGSDARGHDPAYRLLIDT